MKDLAFAYGVPLTGDFPASQMLAGVDCDPARRARVMSALDVDPSWRMHRVSDGQRRRVQLAYGLLKPFTLLLLDEVTVDLDVLGRAELMKFLSEDCACRGATVVYATHIFDGLSGWATHVGQLCGGKLEVGSADEMLKGETLLRHVERWLRAAKKAGGKEGAGEGGGGGAAKGTAARNNGWGAGRIASTLNGGQALTQAA